MDDISIETVMVIILAAMHVIALIELNRQKQLVKTYREGYTELRKTLSDVELKLRKGEIDHYDLRTNIICRFQTAVAKVSLETRRLGEHITK